jgi:anti-anti-sigma factor
MNDLRAEVTVEYDGSAVVAHLTGEIDQSNAPAILEHLRDVGADRTLTVHLSEVQYFDSAGIAMLEALRHSTDLRLRVSRQSIAGRVLAISGVDQIIPTDSEP